MALHCPTDLNNSNFGFTEFLDCTTLSINYEIMGTATLNFSVVSVSKQPIGIYTTLTFGGVTFNGFITNLEITRLPGTVVYEHRYTITAYGC